MLHANAFLLLPVLGILALHDRPGGSSLPGGCPVDKARYVILPPGEQVTYRDGLNRSEYPLMHADIEQAECLLIAHVDVVNAGLAGEGTGEYIEPAEYHRQYCVLRNSEGHRIVFLNAFCQLPAPHVPWQRTWVEVEDGGACYFQVLFDLTTSEVLEFTMNGIG